MSPLNDINLIHTLTSYAQRMYNVNEIPYEWREVVELIETDPEIFNAFLRRAKRYKLPDSDPKSYRLWISCNLASAYKVRVDCYLCGKVMTREEILAGAVHLEHLFPRSRGGDHTPGNISLVCRPCNLLKHDLQEEDFDLILNNPEIFRIAHSSMRLNTYLQLMDFAEIISPIFKDHNWLIERFGVSQKNWRQVWDKMRSEYRQKWGNE